MGALVFFGFFLGNSENTTRDFDKRGGVGGAEQDSAMLCVSWNERVDVESWFLGGENENSIPPTVSTLNSRAFFEK